MGSIKNKQIYARYRKLQPLCAFLKCHMGLWIWGNGLNSLRREKVISSWPILRVKITSVKNSTQQLRSHTHTHTKPELFSSSCFLKRGEMLIERTDYKDTSSVESMGLCPWCITGTEERSVYSCHHSSKPTSASLHRKAIY